ncbi:MAG: hypothetical protein WBX25_17485 [Rhodomicrobium sp.]
MSNHKGIGGQMRRGGFGSLFSFCVLAALLFAIPSRAGGGLVTCPRHTFTLIAICRSPPNLLGDCVPGLAA